MFKNYLIPCAKGNESGSGNKVSCLGFERLGDTPFTQTSLTSVPPFPPSPGNLPIYCINGSQLILLLFLVKPFKLKSSFPDGKAWKLHPGIRMEGPLLTFKCRKAGKGCKASRRHYHGARYGQPFSLEFPHFEVSFCNIDNNNQTNIISAGLKATDCVTKQKIVLFADFNK